MPALLLLPLRCAASQGEVGRGCFACERMTLRRERSNPSPTDRPCRAFCAARAATGSSSAAAHHPLRLQRKGGGLHCARPVAVRREPQTVHGEPPVPVRLELHTDHEPGQVHGKRRRRVAIHVWAPAGWSVLVVCTGGAVTRCARIPPTPLRRAKGGLSRPDLWCERANLRRFMERELRLGASARCRRVTPPGRSLRAQAQRALSRSD